MLPCLVKEFANRRNQVFINIYLVSFILILISQMFFLAKQTLSRIEFRTNMTTTLETLFDSFGSLCVVVIFFRMLKVHLMLVLQKSTKTLARRIEWSATSSALTTLAAVSPRPFTVRFFILPYCSSSSFFCVVSKNFLKMAFSVYEATISASLVAQSPSKADF